MLGEIRSALLGCAVPVESSQTEYGPGQMEVNISPSGPLEAADNATILKYVVKVVARKHGLRATFMPMPFQEGSGSGHHVHLSLVRRDRTRTCSPARLEGDLLRCLPRGRPRPLVELTAVNLPSVNAYKRLFDYTFAPNRVSWASTTERWPFASPPGKPRAQAGDPDGLRGREPLPDRCRRARATAEGVAGRLQPPGATSGDAYKDEGAKVAQHPRQGRRGFERARSARTSMERCSWRPSRSSGGRGGGLPPSRHRLGALPLPGAVVQRGTPQLG